MSSGQRPINIFRDHRRVYGPLEHADYPELDLLCSCSLCVEWRSRLQQLLPAQEAAAQKFKTCQVRGCLIDMKGPCEECRSGMKLRSSYIASLNRRDLYSECSFHASHMEAPVGHAFMEWVIKVINNRAQRGDGWWVGQAPYFPLQYWITMFKRSISLGIDDLDMSITTETEDLPNMAGGALTLAASSGMSISASGAI